MNDVFLDVYVQRSCAEYAPLLRLVSLHAAVLACGADSKHDGDKPRPRRGRWQRVAIRAGAFWLVCVNRLERQFLRASQQPEHACLDQRWCYFGRILGSFCERIDLARVHHQQPSTRVPRPSGAISGAFCVHTVRPTIVRKCMASSPSTRLSVSSASMKPGAISGEFCVDSVRPSILAVCTKRHCCLSLADCARITQHARVPGQRR